MQIAQYHLLQHPFYQAWMRGELKLSTLQHYAKQYYPHVRAFPRFVSAVHSQCENPAARRHLLENLLEEEGYPNLQNHPTLWQDFAAGLGVEIKEMESAPIGKKAQQLVDIFWHYCRSSYAEGLGVLYAYEHQVPEVAAAKIEGLKKFYAIHDASAHRFFAVHEKADALHAATCAELLAALPAEERAKADRAAEAAALALWDFLSEVYELQHAA